MLKAELGLSNPIPGQRQKPYFSTPLSSVSAIYEVIGVSTCNKSRPEADAVLFKWRLIPATRNVIGVSVYSIIIPPESTGDTLSRHASEITIAATNMPETARLMEIINALKWLIENVDKLQKV